MDHHEANESHSESNVDHHHHAHSERNSHGHSEAIWFGFMTLIGMLSFLMFERIFNIINDLRKDKIDENVSLFCFHFFFVSKSSTKKKKK